MTLHQILVHVVTEAHRHAGHADILREHIDGAVGLRLGNENVGSRRRLLGATPAADRDAAREAEGSGAP